MADFKNLFLSFALIAVALLLIGSNFNAAAPAADHPATGIALEMRRDIPQEHRAEWDALSEEAPLLLFKYSIAH